MATDYKRILVRRGTGDLPSDLAEGELVFELGEEKLYVGTDTGSVEIAKQSAVSTNASAISTNALAISTLGTAVSDNATAISGKEPANANIQTHIGTTTGNPHGVTATDVGLGNVTNESKSTMFTSPALTGTPTAPTAAASTNTTQIATTAFVQQEITDLIGGAGEALNTLNELASALGNDANFSTTVTNSLAGKQETLVSGTNIKTVNSVSLLGSGNIETEWTLVTQIEQTDISSLVVDSTYITYDNDTYDYKFVVDAVTEAYDADSALSIQLNEDTTAGKHSFIYNISRLTGASATATSDVAVGEYGATATAIETGLDLNGQPVTQGSLHFLQAEFVLHRSLVGMTPTVAGQNDVYAYMIRGEGSVAAVEVAENNATTFSLSKISRFTGAFGNTDSENITSVKLLNLPDDGAVDTLKVKIYKRAR